MLDGLDSVAWSQLTHAYGTATDVPDQIRGLVSAGKKTREKALWKLYGNIFHQGTRYQASPHAVPFLVQLVAAPETPDRPEIVYLLVSLALGYEESLLPGGLDVAAWRRSVAESESEMSVAERADCDRYGYGPQVDLDCYDAARQGVPALLDLLADGEARLRRAAAYALAWFPEDALRSLPALRERLAQESGDIDVANLLLAIGLLARTSGAADASPASDFLPHDSLIVRVAAAVALSRDPLAVEVVEILLEAVLSAIELDGRGDDIRFNEGNLAAYASLVLAHGGDEARDRAIPALCSALESVNARQSLDVTSALLSFIVEGKEKPIEETPLDALDPLELRGLRAIADHGGWTVDGGIFVNYCELVRSYGLPDSQAALAEYLDHGPSERRNPPRQADSRSRVRYTIVPGGSSRPSSSKSLFDRIRASLRRFFKPR